MSSKIFDEVVDSDYEPTEVKKSRFYVLYFTASWCKPCKRFSPLIKDFCKACPDVALISGIVDDDEKNYHSYLNELKLKYNLAFDCAEEIMHRYNFDSLPSTLVFDRDYNVVKFNLREELKPDNFDKVYKALKKC